MKRHAHLAALISLICFANLYLKLPGEEDMVVWAIYRCSSRLMYGGCLCLCVWQLFRRAVSDLLHATQNVLIFENLHLQIVSF